MTTTLVETETALVDALTTIARHWDALVRVNLARQAGSGSRSVGIRNDPDPATDHDPSEADVDRLTRIVSIRRHCTETLNGWCRVVIEDRPVEVALPDGTSVPSMVEFLQRHAQWFSGHDSVDDALDELQGFAHRIRSAAQPHRREWMSLGECPLEVEFDPAAGLEVCGGQVRAWPRPDDRDGEVTATCQRCGTEAVPAWWEVKMFGEQVAEAKQWLTDPEVVTLVHTAFGRVVTAATVRQWVRRGVLTPSTERDARGRRLFSRESVVWALSRAERQTSG